MPSAETEDCRVCPECPIKRLHIALVAIALRGYVRVMNKRFSIIIGSGFLLVVGTTAFAWISQRKITRPESLWDARYSVSPTDYGMRFRNEPASPSTVTTLPDMSVVEVKNTANPSAKESVFEIKHLRYHSRSTTIPGTPEEPVDPTRPIVFSDGSEARLKLIVGMDCGVNSDSESRFAWAMTPDGKPISREEARSLGWFAEVGGSWPTRPHAIHCLFELKGKLRLCQSGIADTVSGNAITCNISYGTKGSNQLLLAPIHRWDSAPRELIFIAYHGPLKTADLPAVPGSQINLDGTPVRHHGAFNAFTGSGSGHASSDTLNRLTSHGSEVHRIHFVQLPKESGSDEFLLLDRNDKELSSFSTLSGGGRVVSQPLDAPGDFIRVAKYTGVRRIRMRLPAFPSNAEAPIADPLDIPIPSHWDRQKIDLRTAMHELAAISIHAYGSRVHSHLEHKLSDFPGKNTLREILAVALDEELRDGDVVSIDRTNRTLRVEKPEPAWWEKIGAWFKKTAARFHI